MSHEHTTTHAEFGAKTTGKEVAEAFASSIRGKSGKSSSYSQWDAVVG